MHKGERPKPLPHLKVCTLVCTLAYSNPMYGQKIVLGPSGRIPYTYWRIVKNGVRVVGSQSRRAQRVSQDHRADNNRTCIGRALGRIPFRKALYSRSPVRSQHFQSLCIPFASRSRLGLLGKVKCERLTRPPVGGHALPGGQVRSYHLIS